MSSNGQMRRSELAKITVASNGEQAYLRRDAARAFMALNWESERVYGVTLRVSSARVAYRDLASQRYFWGLYQSGRGNLAARPGTSNHGLGIAVDLTPESITIVNKIGHKYGFAKKWSDAPTEPWHFRWRAGRYDAVEKVYAFSATERRFIREYDILKRQNRNLARRRVLRAAMKVKAKAIQAAAKGTKKGWATNSRRYRFNELSARS